MRYWISAFVLMVVLSGCLKSTRSMRSAELKAMVSAQTKCKDIRTLSSGHAWRLLQVCGKRRYYEYGVWCNDCSWSWRERP